METQTQSAPAPNESGPEPRSGPSPTSARLPSPVQPPVDLMTHYANGLPRSINGLNGNGVNGSRPQSPAIGSPSVTTSAQPSAPSQTTGTTASIPTPSPASTLPPIAAAPSKLPNIPLPGPPLAQTPPHQRSPARFKASGNSSHKVSIVDPPGTYSRKSSTQSHPTSQGFPSPKREHHLENPKFVEDQSRLTHAMQQSVSSAVRRAVRDNWQKCLLGSEFHHAFLLNAVIHHSNGVIIRRSIKDFGAKMVTESKHEIISHFMTPDLDELADEILQKASDYFLDCALERRLKTIDARSLINALARAERLGYENSDVIEDHKEDGSNFNPTPAHFDPSPDSIVDPALRSQHRQSLPSLQQGRNLAPILQCPLCWRKFENTQPYEYHVQKQVCTKQPQSKEGFPLACKHCGAGFLTKVGQQYHIANHVCGEHGTMPATPKAPTNTISPITLSSGNNSPIHPPSNLPPPRTFHEAPLPSQPLATPIQPKGSAASTPGSQIKDHDPYAHLHPSTLERLNDELRQAEITYTARFKEAEQIQDPAQRQVKLEGLQNSFSTKQSIIRKKYGVRLRNRRTRAEIDNERQRMGWKYNAMNNPDDTPSAKRRRTDDGSGYVSAQTSNDDPILTLVNAFNVADTPANGDLEHKSKHLPAPDMNAGLGGSSATAATADPTLAKRSSASPPSQLSQVQELAQNSLSSLQKKGYRVSSHIPHPNQASPEDTTMEESTPTQRSNSASAPILVKDDDSSSDSESDGDIPASVPPARPVSTSAQGLAG
ncbi:uncharacterized protein GGS22DRAFT_149314 [Annulohypoxylon maeteangense]|uniref:uncharacterized protein n=1 Tax=Annulohypoxylon maeteangense TaxID=1927788 RepID=UPI0020073DB8|nr:uncharacterized protein GGS22DRAFT_149314 [Annulohypoxylon maeteangense]KAI0889859.1 hypothetical protein GGS22DRAFT_149314 [Annulohypoxylon maeteangense]